MGKLNGKEHLVSNQSLDFHLFVMHYFTDFACKTSTQTFVLIIRAAPSLLGALSSIWFGGPSHDAESPVFDDYWHKCQAVM